MHLNHLHFGVRDLALTQRFYERAFGMWEKAHHGECVILTDGSGFDLALDPSQPPSHMGDSFHLGFRLVSADTVRRSYFRMQEEFPEALAESLEEAEDTVSFRLRDPEGRIIEIYWEPQRVVWETLRAV